MEHSTGSVLNGTYIRLGDRLRGRIAVESIVLWDEENNEYGVSISGRPESWFELNEYLQKWDDLQIIGNINKRR